MINIGFIFEKEDDTIDYQLVKNVRIDATEYTEVPIPEEILQRGVPSAYIVNDGELAYGVFVID